MPSRVALLGGTFDPIHLGHLILAEEACDQLGLDRVYILPAADPPHKQNRRLVGAEDRIRMVELAIRENPAFQLSRVDVDRPGPHYTVDTVRLFRGQLPPGAELFFLMGNDSLMDLPKWYKPSELLASCRLVAFTRHNALIDWPELEHALPGVREHITLLDMPELEIASRDIQDRVRAGRTIRYLVPESVRLYIEEHSLYRW
jgi:nicotinate-nucleotide adenylyltransferase